LVIASQELGYWQVRIRSIRINGEALLGMAYLGGFTIDQLF
jgi:hypothetical protein